MYIYIAANYFEYVSQGRGVPVDVSNLKTTVTKATTLLTTPHWPLHHGAW